MSKKSTENRTTDLIDFYKKSGLVLVKHNQSKYAYPKKPYNIYNGNSLNRNEVLFSLPGKDSNLTVVDIDIQDKGMELWHKLIEKHGEIDTRIDCTPSGGLHYYFKYCDKVQHKTKHIVDGCKYGIDILNKKLCIMAPTYRGPNFNKKQGPYKNINNNNINEMPEWLINWIIKYQSCERKSDINNTNKLSTLVNKNNNEIKCPVTILVNNLSNERADTYDTWINVLICLKSLSIKDGDPDKYLELACDFSSRSTKYIGKLDIQNKWNSINRDELNIGNLYNWVKHDVCDIVKRTSIFRLVANVDDEKNLFKGERGFSNIYIKYFADDIKFINKKLFYRWDNDTKLWKKEEDNETLMNDLYNLLESILRSHKDRLNSEIDRLYKIINVDFKDTSDSNITYDEPYINKCTKRFNIIKLQLKSINVSLNQITSSSKQLNILRQAYGELKNIDFENQLDKNRNLIPLNNGTILDFCNGDMKLRERTREDMFSRAFNVSLPYEIIDDTYIIKHTGYYDKIDSFMSKIMNNDEETLRYFQKLIGYSISDNTSDRSFSIWYGIGSNGKSTMIDILMKIMGSYYSTLSKDVLIKSSVKSSSGQATPELIPLKNAWMCVVNETEEHEILNDGQIKLLSGGTDSIQIRPLYKEQITIKPKSKIILCTNHMPKLNITDMAMIDRLRCVPFNARFVENPKDCEFEKNPDLVDELINNHLDSFFEWFIIGLQDWYNDKKIIQSKKALEFTNKYINDNDTLQQFLDNKTDKCKGNKIKRSVFIEAYESYCYDNGILFNKRRAVQEINKRLIVKKYRGYDMIYNLTIIEESNIE